MFVRFLYVHTFSSSFDRFVTAKANVTNRTSLYFHYGYSKITQIAKGVKQNETETISIIKPFQIYKTN